MSEIKISPEELRETADYLVTEHQTIVDLVDKMVKDINSTTDNWEGAAQLQFVDTFTEQMAPALKESLPNVVEGISNQLKGAADAMQETDEGVADAYEGN
ncbi:MAG: WXG100 family type VII secretion target [Pseudobutyrivibrio sp.]|nr:WXG100 family type VII secretion target [Pseudobutyrivibrio sp.]